VWLDENGRELSAADWHVAERRCLAMLIRGLNHEGHEGHEKGSALLLLINADEESRTFKLPIALTWWELINTYKSGVGERYENEVALTGRTLILLESIERDRTRNPGSVVTSPLPPLPESKRGYNLCR
jgi:pullulanase/glycogen debranching enzyme